jgi:hypothetical protein
LRDKQILCKLLNNLQQYKLVDEWTKEQPELINERFFMLIKYLNKSSTNPKITSEIIIECDEILKSYPLDITSKNQGQYKLYKAKTIYKKEPQTVLLLLDNYSMYYVSGNVSSSLLYLDALLLTMECHIALSAESEKIKNIEDKFLKVLKTSKLEGKIFERNLDKIEEKYNNLKKKFVQYN